MNMRNLLRLGVFLPHAQCSLARVKRLMKMNEKVYDVTC